MNNEQRLRAAIVSEFNTLVRAALLKKLIDDATIKAMRGVASDIYNAIGPDMGWGDSSPSTSEFVSVMRDRMHDELEGDLAVAWAKMSVEEKRWLLIDVL